MNKRMIILAASAICGVSASTAMGGAHTWRVNELFSNADGTIQFIELRECCGGPGEVFLSGLQVTSQSTGNAFTFPANLVGPTSNKHILLATAAFAALPGAPAVNHTIPAGFFNPNGDTVRYHVYDALTFTTGQLPTDCLNSLGPGGATASNTPTNYAGQAGQVDCGEGTPCPPDIAPAGGNGEVNVDDLLAIINAWGPCGDPNNCPADIAPKGGNDQVNVDDLLAVINGWGLCAP